MRLHYVIERNVIFIKVRADFVTNSSSSSFIIALKKKPETIGEFYDSVFGKYEYGDLGLIKRLFDDMPEQGMTKDELISEFMEEDWVYEELGWNSKLSWEEEQEFNKKKGKEESEKFLKGKDDNFIFSVEYEDHGDNMEYRLRESSVLDNLEHKTFSHH